jgi:hypothetical protein
MRLVKLILLVLGSALALLAITQVKPALHHLKAAYGWWGWSAGMLAVVAATGVLLWISAKLMVAVRSKRAPTPPD